MSDLKVMLLCGRSPRPLYVANALCEAADVKAIVQETGSEWNAKKVYKLLRPDNLTRKLWRWLRDRWRCTGNAEARFFFGDETTRLTRPELVVDVPHINHPDVVTLADRLQPDPMCVFGTLLIPSEFLSRGLLGNANLHGGLAPDYGGADCTFRALYNREPEKVGCTLHWIDRDIGTGRLIAHISPEIRPDDGELSLFWRGVRDSAAVYAEFVRRLAAGERFGQTQPSRGRLCQVKQRGLRHELVLARLLGEGLLKEINLGRRIVWYPEKAVSP